jgi:MFS family permease
LTSQTRSPKLFYGYIIVAAAFLIQIVAWGFYNVYGVFFNPILAEFGWSRAIISASSALSQIMAGIGATTLGNLNDRFGPRVLMTICGFTLGLGFFLLSQVHSIWQLYLFGGAIVGLGVSGTDVILLSTTARWFVRRRGMMSGIVKMGTGVGTMVAPLIVAWLIQGYGWRDAYVVVGIIIVVVVVSCTQLLRRTPAHVGQLPDGEIQGNIPIIPLEEKGLSLGQAMHTRRFWFLCAAWPMVLFCTFAVLIHIPPHVVDLGFSESFGATMIAIVGGASIAGRFVMGTAGDRIGYKRALIINFAVLTAAFTWLLMARQIWSLSLFALIYGFCHGGFYALYSPAIAEFFGTRSHGTLLGILILSGSIGGFLGPIITGYVFDTTGSYQNAFLLLVLLALVGMILMLLAGKISRKEFSSAS